MVPEASLVWLDDTSHFAQVDTPEPVVAELRRFLGAGEGEGEVERAKR